MPPPPPSPPLPPLPFLPSQVTLQVDKDSKEAAQAANKTKASGLDAFLAELEKKKKVRAADVHVPVLSGVKHTWCCIRLIGTTGLDSTKK